MKKIDVINLIKYYSEKNDYAFRNEAYKIANDFDKSGDVQLAEYIMALLSDANTFVPQSSDYSSTFFEKVEINNSSLLFFNFFFKFFLLLFLNHISIYRN